MPKPYYKPNPVRGAGAEQYEGVPSRLSAPWPERKRNVRLVGHSDLNGWGDAFQIQVRGGLCYVMGSGVNGHNGMTVLDVSDPARPKIVHQFADRPTARTHKVLLIEENVLLTNVEKKPGADDPEVIPGLRIFDNTDPRKPRFVGYAETEGLGIHRPVYDPRRKLLYSSGFKDGCRGKILLVHDMRDPFAPELIGAGWVEGQNEAAGEKPSWDFDLIGWNCWLHEANPFGDYLTCGYWDGGICLFDLAEPAKPKFLWRQNPHETHGWPGCYHTFLVPDGSEFALVTHETTTVNCDHPPAFVTFYDMRDIHNPIPTATFMPYEIDPIEMRPLDKRWSQTGSRYGAHNVWLDMVKDDLMYICWFNAGLRIVDWSNPFRPTEVGYSIPEGTKERFCPQSNDVQVDRDTGLIYVADRWGLGLHILEYTG
ncbi:MAG: LVIVD repeat-containing protein [Nitrospinota bacterium]